MTDDRILEEFARTLRGTDPLPEGPAFSAELGAALARTRRAVAAEHVARAARAAGAWTAYAAPWGPVHLAVGTAGILAVELQTTPEAFVHHLARRVDGPVLADDDRLPGVWRARLDRARNELAEYFEGRRTAFDVAVDLRGISDWDRLVLEGARRLGFGEVTSYGRLAGMIGRPGAARAVGGALGRNPIPIVIPCHRILAGDGSLGGYGGGWPGRREAMLDIKLALLRHEGVSLPAHFPS